MRKSPPSDELLSRYAPLRPVFGCESIVAHQACNFFTLWQAWEEESGCEREIPFWAAVWPAAAVFARYITEGRIDVRGLSVLDLGCGGGVAGISAVMAGARRVIANDIDPVAINLAERNAVANRVRFQTDVTDLVQNGPLQDVDVVLAADLFYTKSESLPMLDFLRRLTRRGTLVFIADGQRKFAPRSDIRTLGLEVVPVDRELEGTEYRRVRLMNLV